MAPKKRRARLKMPRGNALHSEISRGVTGKLKHLGREILEDRRRVHRSRCADPPLPVDSCLQVAVDSTDRELQHRRSDAPQASIRSRWGDSIPAVRPWRSATWASLVPSYRPPAPQRHFPMKEGARRETNVPRGTAASLGTCICICVDRLRTINRAGAGCNNTAAVAGSESVGVGNCSPDPCRPCRQPAPCRRSCRRSFRRAAPCRRAAPYPRASSF